MPEIKLVYQQIREHIENEIKSKKPGEFLNSEVQYSTLFGVSRPTVRKAVDELCLSGLVKRLPGKGLIVCDPYDQAKTGILLFLIPYIPDDGFSYNIVMGCIDAANKSEFGYRLFNFLNPSERLDWFKSIDLSAYSGVILTAYENSYDHEILSLMKKYNIPFVLVDNPLDNYECPYVVTDDFNGGYMSGKHITAKGHKNILYLTLQSKDNTVISREMGFKKALKDNGITLPDENIIRISSDDEAESLISSLDLGFTAVCGYSDIPVIKAFNVLNERGLKVPDDISLIGYGNFKASELLSVPLTTISMPVYEMGYSAVEMIVNNIMTGTSMKKVALNVELVERNSVAECS